MGYCGGRELATGQVSLGNAIEFWSVAVDINIHDNYIFQSYDAALTHQGPSGTVNPDSEQGKANNFTNIHYENNLLAACDGGNQDRKAELIALIEGLKLELARDDENRAKNPKIAGILTKIKAIELEIAKLEEEIREKERLCVLEEMQSLGRIFKADVRCSIREIEEVLENIKNKVGNIPAVENIPQCPSFIK